jgi:hypothetical protein
MRQEIEEKIMKTKIYCDICGKETPETHRLSVTVTKDYLTNTVAEYGLGFTNTGDWCESCRDRLDYLVEQALRGVLVERYEIDHSGKNKTVEFYKKVLES